MKYFHAHMVDNILAMQGGCTSIECVATASPVESLDEMATEVLKCCCSLELHKVCETYIIQECTFESPVANSSLYCTCIML